MHSGNVFISHICHNFIVYRRHYSHRQGDPTVLVNIRCRNALKLWQICESEYITRMHKSLFTVQLVSQKVWWMVYKLLKCQNHVYAVYSSFLSLPLLRPNILHAPTQTQTQTQTQTHTLPHHPPSKTRAPNTSMVYSSWHVEVYLHSFFTFALDKSEWSASRFCRFTPGKKIQII